MYFLIGLIIGFGLLALILWLRNKKVVIKWYEWLIGITGLALLLYVIQNITSFAVQENSAPLILFLVIGLPALLLLAVAGLLPWLRYHRLNQ